jgi:class 3 adenylate cyclase/tetratricopeptide (TPR) repeat protein
VAQEIDQRTQAEPETLVRTCPQCGADLPADARFCPNCGAAVDSFVTEERKVVTVLFVDLSASTELAARLDPERFREVMTAFYRLASTELASLRGRAEKFIGDAVMAVFGVPHAHEDDALRAVRAALIIRDRVGRLGQSLDSPVPLQIHAGINSGSVAVGSGPSDQFLVSGSAVSLAARLQEAAEPGETLVGETTKQLTRYAVAFGEARSIAARGFQDDVTAWPVTSLSPRSSRRAIPMVGRRRELAMLSDTFERVRDSRRIHLVTVLGEAGIGKTRLVDEFLAALPEDVKILAGRASEFEEDPAFAPLAEMVRRELGVDRDTPDHIVSERLREVIQGCCEPSDVEQVAARLGLALGLGDESREGQRYRAAEIRSGFHTFLAGLALRGPVVLVFEDMQIARPALLDLVEQLVRRSRRIPILVVCLARDKLLEVRPQWGGGIADSVTVRLETLPFEEAKDLAAAAGEPLPEAEAERIALAAGGNPFFIVETTGMLMHERVEHDFVQPEQTLLPPTVQAVVASRFDHLEDPARDLVRKASVFARSTFTPSELAIITEPNRDVLQQLEDEEIFVRDPEREDVWRFRHETLRTVAYESLPKRERLRLHLQVADRLIEAGEEERYPQAIAYHLAQAARASLDLDPGDRSLADRAVKALTRAGDVTRWRMESRTAIDQYQWALALAGPPDRWGPREARILSSLGEASYWLGEFEEAAASLTRALEIGGADPWVRTHGNRFLGDIALNIQGDATRAAELFEEALAAARQLDDQWAMARTLLMAGWAPYWHADMKGARSMFEEALAIARSNPKGDPWAEARALASLASVISQFGDEEESLALSKEALALGEKMGDSFTVGVAREKMANAYRTMWRLDEALPCSNEAARIFRELGARWELASAIGDRGAIYRLLGRLSDAEVDLREALEICKQLGERSLVSWTVAQLAYVKFLQGEVAEARRVLADPAAQATPGDFGSDAVRLATEALIDLAEGDRDRATEGMLRALELTRAEGLPNPVAARTWWTGSLLGPDAVGGEQEMEMARRRLEEAHWIQSVKEAELAQAGRQVEPI